MCTFILKELFKELKKKNSNVPKITKCVSEGEEKRKVR